MKCYCYFFFFHFAARDSSKNRLKTLPEFPQSPLEFLCFYFASFSHILKETFLPICWLNSHPPFQLWSFWHICFEITFVLSHIWCCITETHNTIVWKPFPIFLLILLSFPCLLYWQNIFHLNHVRILSDNPIQLLPNSISNLKKMKRMYDLYNTLR